MLNSRIFCRTNRSRTASRESNLTNTIGVATDGSFVDRLFAYLTTMNAKKALEELDSMASQFIGHEKTNVFAEIAGVVRALEKYAQTTEPDVAGDYAHNRTERGQRLYGACREIRPVIYYANK